MWTTTAAISTSHFSSALGDKALLFCVHVPYTDAEVFQSCHNKVLILGLHYFPFMLSTTCSIVTIFHTNNTLYVYLRVGPCHHTGSTCSSVYQLSVCVYTLSINAVNEKAMTGLQTSRQQVGKRHIPKFGDSQACWDCWVSGQTHVLPEQPWRWIFCLEKKKCEKESEKSRGSGKKIHMGALRWQCVECQEEWTHDRGVILAHSTSSGADVSSIKE